MPESEFSSLLNRDLGWRDRASRSGAKDKQGRWRRGPGWSTPWAAGRTRSHYLSKQERFLGGAAQKSFPACLGIGTKLAALGSGESRSAPSLGTPWRKDFSRRFQGPPWPRRGRVPSGRALNTEVCGLGMPGVPAINRSLQDSRTWRGLRFPEPRHKLRGGARPCQ